MYRVSVALAVVTACGGSSTKPPSTWKLPADATMGICADGQSAVTGPAALLEAGAAALRRGCPKEALLDANAVMASGTDKQQAAALLLRVEASQEARAQSLRGDANPAAVLQEPPWLAAIPERDLAALERLADAVGTGTLDPAARDSGRLLRAVVRFAPAIQCLKTVSIQTDMLEDHIKFTNAAIRKFGVKLMPGRTGGGLAAAATSELGRCELTSAAQGFEDAAAAERNAGRAASAFAFQLQAWEARELPGGRAAVLGTGFPAPIDDVIQHARDLEAAPHGGGAAIVGTRASASLDQLVKAAGVDGNQDPEVLWLRAVLTQRFLARPEDAFQLAARAEARAIATKRADLVDAARFVGALAAVEIDRAEDARRLLHLLFASVERRGRWGTVRWLSNAVQVMSSELVRRGQPASALALVTHARDAIGTQSPELGLALSALIARTMTEQGRLEDALAEYEKLATGPAGSVMVTAIRDLSRSRVEDLRESLGLGLPRSITTNQVPAIQALVALQDGNLGPLRAVLAKPFEPENIALIGYTCAASIDQVTPMVEELVQGLAVLRTGEHLKGLDDKQLEQAGLQYGTMLAELYSLPEPLMACAARMRSRRLFAAARGLAEATFGANEHAEAYEAAVNGRLDLAASRWEALGRKRAAAIDELGGVTMAQASGDALERAALAYLTSGTQLDHAIELLEESRSRSLRAARASKRKDLQDPALAPLAAIERELAQKVKRVRALAELGRGADRATKDALTKASATSEAELAALEAKRDTIARGIRSSDPRAYRAAALSPPPSLKEIQGKLATDEVVVFYVIEPLDAHAIVIDRTNARAVALASRSEDDLPLLDPMLRRYRAEIRNHTSGRALRRVDDKPSTTDLRSLRRELYRMLVSPLERYIPANARVIVIPDGVTSDVAFAELGEPTRPWIERNAIRVLPNARLLFDASSTKLDARRALIVGDPDFKGAALAADQQPWPQLPGTRAEATQVAGLLGVSPLLGRDANERALVSKMPGASLIHFATHGLAELARPAYSMVVLSHATSAPQDGLLHAYEIERMRLDAQLVVLSACETGRGQARGSEGVMALDRAFLVAGAGAVVSSLWVVPDDSTSALMIELYKQLRAGKPADLALAIAMRAVRRQPKWADPVYWAAFRVVGAGLR